MIAITTNPGPANELEAETAAEKGAHSVLSLPQTGHQNDHDSNGSSAQSPEILDSLQADCSAESAPRRSLSPPGQLQVSKVKVQKPFKCYRRKGTNGSWIVDGKPLTPLLTKKGEMVVGTRVQETWPDKASGEARKDEINDLLRGHRRIPMIQSNLSADQNMAAEEFFITNKLSVHQIRGAIQLYRELAQLKHPEWVPEKLATHAATTDFRQDASIPMMPEALDRFIACKERGDEHHAAIREDTSRFACWVISLLKASFRNINANQFTDELALKWINGDSTLERDKIVSISVIENGKPVTKETTITVKCGAERPWEVPSNNAIRIRVASIRNWFAAQGWGSRSKIKLLKEGDDIIAKREEVNRVLTTKEKQAIVDNAYAYKPAGKKMGFYAAHFIQRLFGGCRKKETERADPAGFKEEEGNFGLNRSQTKTKKSRKSTCMPIYTMLAAELNERGLFERENLNPPKSVIETILAMSGFEYKGSRFKRFKDIMIPGNYFPFNGIRRSAISAHFQVTENSSTTAAWAGTSGGQWDIWYERSYTKLEAREHWQLPPTFIRVTMSDGDLESLLPEGHKLDNVVNERLKALIARAKAAGHEIAADEAEEDEQVRAAKAEERKEYWAAWHKANPDSHRKAHRANNLKNRLLADQTGLPCYTAAQRKTALELRKTLLPEQIEANIERAQAERDQRAANAKLTPEQQAAAKKAAAQALYAALTPAQRARRIAMVNEARRRRKVRLVEVSPVA